VIWPCGYPLHFGLDLESPCNYSSRNDFEAGHRSYTAVHAYLAVSVEVTTPTRDFGMHTCSHFISGTYSPSQLCRRHHTRNRGFCRKTQPTTAQHATVTAQPRSTNGQLSPHQKIAKAFAPATIANLGPGFDWMGCAVEVCLKLKQSMSHSCPRRLYGAAALYQLMVVLSPKYARHSLYKRFRLVAG